MDRKLEISFNSPQCGWMSIGFNDGVNEFHTTTAHAPHQTALPDLIRILTDLASKDGGAVGASTDEYILKWNRDPEEFDFHFVRSGDEVLLEIYEYPTDDRVLAERELVYSFTGPVRDVIAAFAETFHQLYEDRDTDEFEFNWRQPFPHDAYEMFNSVTDRLK